MENETLDEFGHAMDCIANIEIKDLSDMEKLHLSEAYCILAGIYYDNGGPNVRTPCTFY